MCGISVILDPRGSPESVDRVLAMHAAIPHRGPDGEGFLAFDATRVVTRCATSDALRGPGSPRACLAFRRLKVCDLSDAAAQPMGAADGKTWLAFNGEIYNFREIRRELEARGRRFLSSGDTEVALAAYEEWGVRCFERFDGMWAMAILDLHRDRLVVSRDRFGIKPLYWALDDGGALLLASEIKQIHAARPGRALRSNRPLVAMFLRGQRYPALEETFFEGVRAVPPACWAEVSLSAPGAPSFQPYWRLEEHARESGDLSYADARDRVALTLGRAVDSHRHADVKVGALLSGGLDSSTIVALSHREGRPRMPTYSFGFRESAPRFCEMRFVDELARRDGLENREISFDPGWIAGNVDRVLWALEEPPLALAPFAQYRVFELCASDGATVVLDGQGSDEITAGYGYHQRAFLKERLLGGRGLELLAESRAIARREGRSTMAVLSGFFLEPRFRKPANRSWIADGGVRGNLAEFEAARGDYGPDRSLVNRQLFFDVRWGNVKIVLGYGDRNAMAHSVEARVPYFDREFVELMFSLPDHFKIGNGDRKRILRDVARRHLPEALTERADRMGYGSPEADFLRGPLGDVVAEALEDTSFQACGWVVVPAMRRLLLDFQRGIHHDHAAIWRLFALSRWSRRFAMGE